MLEIALCLSVIALVVSVSTMVLSLTYIKLQPKDDMKYKQQLPIQFQQLDQSADVTDNACNEFENQPNIIRPYLSDRFTR